VIRIAGLFAAACLFAVLLVLGPQASHATFGPLWTAGSVAPPPPPPTSNACGTESAPPQAVAAGFTTCAINFDFTATTGSSWLPSQYAFSGVVSNASNWLDCVGSNTALPFHVFYPTTNSQCSNQIFVTTDGGVQVADLQVTVAQYNAGNNTIVMATSANSYNGPFTPGWPNNAYVEYYMRQDAGASNTAGGNISIYTFSQAPAIAFNLAEMYAGSNTYSDGGTGGGYPGSDQQVSFYWNGPGQTPYGAGCFNGQPTCYANTPSSYETTSYNNFGGLLSSNGSSSLYGCAYIDNLLQGCDNGNNAWQASQYNNTNFFIINDSPSRQPSATVDLYIQHIRVWSCANWATQECNGSTLITGNNNTSPLTPSYWKQ
jgi:hypothetical protein